MAAEHWSIPSIAWVVVATLLDIGIVFGLHRTGTRLQGVVQEWCAHRDLRLKREQLVQLADDNYQEAVEADERLLRAIEEYHTHVYERESRARRAADQYEAARSAARTAIRQSAQEEEARLRGKRDNQEDEE